MVDFYSRLGLASVNESVIRNIVSIRQSQDLFDDLSANPQDWPVAQQAETDARPYPYRSATPIIDRPFEDATWLSAIGWPFTHKQSSRFSDGSFGAWYGCSTAQTSVYETVYHWYRNFLSDAGFNTEGVVGERKLYAVNCEAALVDLRPLLTEHPDLTHRTDYTRTQAIGAKFHREGHPGLLTKSARFPDGDNYVILNPSVLSNPKIHSFLTYRIKGQNVIVEKETGKKWLSIPIDAL